MTRFLYKLHTVYSMCMYIYIYIYICVCEAIACVYVIVSIERLTILGGASVVLCTDLGGKELHRHVGVRRDRLPR